MSNSILARNDSDAISGFYYDQQLRRPELIMSLHPNMEIDKSKSPNDDGYWTRAKEVIESTKAGGGDNVAGYSIIPIAVAILSEDFQIGAANQFDDNSITDDITSIFNSVKPLSVYADKIREMTASEEAGRDFEQNIVTKGLNKAMGILGGIAGKVTPYLNRALVVQGSRFSTYNGTGVAFGNLSMKFTLFSDWSSEIISAGDRNTYSYDKSWKWMSCVDKVKDIVPYCMGTFSSANFTEGGLLSKTAANVLNEFVGWQIPPGGYKPDLKNLDNVQEGTLMAVFGGMYCIKNLVIQDAQFNFSKQKIKVPLSTSGNMIKDVPMYCDVQLTLKPAAKYSDVSFMRAVEGTDIEVLKTTVTSEYNTRLQKLMK